MSSWFSIAGMNLESAATLLTLALPLLLWSLAWKGVALWKAARLGHKAWFVVLLVVNTVGILEIIYIFAVANRKTVGAPNVPTA
jgi:hypothetical protein